MKRLILLLFCLATIQPAWGGSDGKGGQPGAFREVALGGRAAGMGGAFTAIGEDGAGFLYNPAGGAQSRKYTVSFSYRLMHLDRRLGYAVLNIPAREDAALSISWTYSGTSELDARDEQGYIIEGQSFSQSESLIGLGFSKVVIPQLILGGKVFYVQNNIGNINAYTAGVDLGALSKIDIQETYIGRAFPLFRAGFVVENIGANYKWTTTDFWQSLGSDRGSTITEDFPVYYRLGLGFEKPRQYLLTLDLEYNSAAMFKSNIGGEYNLNRALALRTGLDDFHPTFGIGLSKLFTDFTVMFDFSYLFDKTGEGDDFLASFDIVF